MQRQSKSWGMRILSIALILTLGVGVLIIWWRSSASVADQALSTNKPSAIIVEGAWANPSLAGVKNGAVYVIIRNEGKVGDQLIGAISSVAEQVELHAHLRDGDIMRMRAISAIVIEPGAQVEMGPGGVHIMLLGLHSPLKDGDRLPLTLLFKQSGEMQIEARVERRSPGIVPPHLNPHANPPIIQK